MQAAEAEASRLRRRSQPVEVYTIVAGPKWKDVEEVIVFERDSDWVSPPIAIDGIADLRLQADRLTAKGWFAGDEPWRPIEIDLTTRRVLASARSAGTSGAHNG